MKSISKLVYIKGSGKASILISSIFIAIIFASNFYFSDSFNNPSEIKIIIYSLIYVLIPTFFLFPVILIAQKIFLFNGVLNLFIHLILSLVYVSIFVFLVQFLRLSVDGFFIFNESLDDIVKMLRRQLLISGSMSFLLYWGIVVLSGLQKFHLELSKSTKRSMTLEEQLASATLSTLKAQLKPHFLFNTLNMVDFLIHTDQKKAIKTIEKLEDLIKTTFDKNQPNSCTVETELIFLKKYLDIEKERFQDRLRVNFNIDEEVSGIKIPCYLIQPLVENSIKHGVGKTLDRCTITIQAKMRGSFFTIKVSDNAKNGPRNTTQKIEKGVGLKNIEERIKIYFGVESFLDVGSSSNGNFKSAIVIPNKYLIK